MARTKAELAAKEAEQSVQTSPNESTTVLRYIRKAFGVFVAFDSALCLLLVLKKCYPVVYKYFRKEVVYPILFFETQWNEPGRKMRVFLRENKWLEECCEQPAIAKVVCDLVKEQGTLVKKTSLIKQVVDRLVVNCKREDAQKLAFNLQMNLKAGKGEIASVRQMKEVMREDGSLFPVVEDFLAAEYIAFNKTTEDDVRTIWKNKQSHLFLMFVSGLTDGQKKPKLLECVFDLLFAKCREGYWRNKFENEYFVRVITEELTGVMLKRLFERRLSSLAGEMLMVFCSAFGNYDLIKGMARKGGTLAQAFVGCCEYGRTDIVEKILREDKVDPAFDDDKGLRIASLHENIGIVKLLINEPRVTVGARGNEPLLNAIRKGNVEMTELLLQHGADPSVPANTAILYACTGGHVGVLKVLLEDVRVEVSHKVVEAAMNKQNIECVNLLLKDVRCDPSFRNQWLLARAAALGHYELVKELLKDPRVIPEDNKCAALLAAVEHRQLRIAKLLLSYPKVDPSVGHQLALKTAVRNGDLEMVKLLMFDGRVDPSVDELGYFDRGEQACLRAAAGSGEVEIVKFLLSDPRVVPSALNSDAFRKAVRLNHEEMWKLLLQDKRTDPAANNNEAFREFVKQGRIEDCKLLLTYPNVDPSDLENGGIVLAAMNNDLEMLDFLLSLPSVVPNTTAIVTASRLNNLDILLRLLDDGRADPGGNNNAALEQACYLGCIEIAEILMSDPRCNPADKNQASFLAACSRGHLEIIELMLKDERIDPTANDSECLRRAQYHHKVVDLLLRDGRVKKESLPEYQRKRLKLDINKNK